MSEQLRHKMLEFDVAPPATAWETIAARIDDDTQYQALAAKINNFEAAPPPTMWESISSRIYDDQQYETVAAKMNNFDVSPPPAAWETIAGRIYDDQQYDTIATRMNDFAVAPPQIFRNVLAELEKTKQETTVINIRKIIYRFAVAAVVIGLLIGAWLLNKNNSPKMEVVKNPVLTKPVLPAAKENNKTTDKDLSSQKEVTAIQPENNASGKLKNIHAALTASAAHPLKHAAIDDLPVYHTDRITIPADKLVDENGIAFDDIMRAKTTNDGNYLIVTGPNGQDVRISSKFASVIRYLNSTDSSNGSEEYLDKVIKESSTWKKRFQEWRNKISQSTFIPSSSNFLDISEFKDLIKDQE